MEKRELPEGWEWKKLSDFCNTFTGGTPNRSIEKYFIGNIPWLKSGELKNCPIYSSEESISIDGLNNSNARIIPKGALLIALYGATVGKLGILELDCAINQAICAIVPLKDANLKFLFYYLMYSRNQILNMRIGGAQPNISQGIIRNLWIPLPPLSTQRRIVEILEQADALSRLREQADVETQKFLQSVFYEMFGDPVKNEKGWEVVKLEDVCLKITDGTHITPNYIEKGVPFLSVKNLTKGYLDFNNVKYISESEHKNLVKRCKPEKGDILYTKVGTYGIAEVIEVDTEFSIFVSLALLKPKTEKIDPIYLKFILNSHHVKRQADRKIRGIGVPDLHLIEIRHFKIPLPPPSLQLKFVRFVNDVKNVTTLQNQTQNEINTLFNSLMTNIFNGTISSNNKSIFFPMEGEN